jgi:hypothetical protein
LVLIFDKSKVNWPFYADAKGVPHKHLISCCDAGLCNRLLSAAGSARIAVHTGRKLCLWWPINGADGVGVPFDTLFSSAGIHLLDAHDVHWMFNASHSLKVYRPDEFNAVKTHDPEHLVLLRLYTWPYFHNESVLTSPAHSTAFNEVKDYLRCFQPVSNVLDRVRSLCIPAGTFGVHVRREAPFNGSTLDKFFNAVDQHLAEKSRRPFFLATDYLAVEDEFRRRYGKLAITQPKVCWPKRDPNKPSEARASEIGMLESAVDLYGLAQCPTLIGTAHSSFSRCASWLNECGKLIEI